MSLSLPLGAAIGERRLQLDGRLLATRLSAKEGEEQTAVVQLEKLAAEFD